MLVETAPQSNGARILRRSLPFAVAGLVAVALITGYSVVFAQDITSLFRRSSSLKASLI